MGGTGSGRKSGKRCTDDMNPLDVRKLQRQDLLNPGRAFSWQWTCNEEVYATIDLRVEVGTVVLNYRSRSRHENGGAWESMSYAVQLDWTPCAFGGRRVWWRCPLPGCGRRVAVLYGGRVFACRHCHQLAYRCQREADDDRAIRRADTIRRRLKWVPGIANGVGPKPLGMHWRTFARHEREHQNFWKAAYAGMRLRFQLLGEDLDPWL
jgi:hypothetical protein